MQITFLFLITYVLVTVLYVYFTHLFLSTSYYVYIACAYVCKVPESIL